MVSVACLRDTQACQIVRETTRHIVYVFIYEDIHYMSCRHALDTETT